MNRKVSHGNPLRKLIVTLLLIKNTHGSPFTCFCLQVCLGLYYCSNVAVSQLGVKADNVAYMQ